MVTNRVKEDREVGKSELEDINSQLCKINTFKNKYMYEGYSILKTY